MNKENKRRRLAPVLTPLRKTLGQNRGAAAVEMALVLPLLLMLIFGIFAFGQAYNNYLAITHAAREGARMAAVGDYDEATVIERAYPAIPDSISVTYPNGNVVGESVEVTIVDQFDLEIPFFGEATIPLTSTVVMRIEDD